MNVHPTRRRFAGSDDHEGLCGLCPAAGGCAFEGSGQDHADTSKVCDLRCKKAIVPVKAKSDICQESHRPRR